VRPAGIHHVAICVRDVDEACAFYVDKLGFFVAPRPDSIGPGVWLDGNGAQVHLMQVEEPAPAIQHFAIRVTDLETAASDLERAGVEVNRTDYIPGAGRQAFLHDPSGNFIELNQPD
jgi:catechol 2,3-dioxygenase-like lactoylglutathione lyase family enzyme